MFKTYGFWTALAGMLTIVVSALGKIFGFAIDDGIITEIVMAIAGFLVAIGVISVPKQLNKDKDLSPKEDNEDLSEDDKEDKNVDDKEN